ncbi:beta/gamma crystallin-related protein [Hyphobacterium sp.]|uniref:beta/gamma crystallin-related protein n=1 Tax=Hyphobacterium sp. TaxID=2004662 RepID=UPI003BA946C2
MNWKWALTALIGVLVFSAAADAQRGNRALTFYSQPNFQGQSVTINTDVTNFQSIGFNDRALSVRVEGRGTWTVCQHSNFGGVCRQISTDIPHLNAISLDGHISSARMEYGAGRPGGTRPGGRPGRGNRALTFYSQPNFQGQSVTIDTDVTNFQSIGFNDRALSVRVEGRGSWTICQDSNFRGVCREISRDISHLNQLSLDGHVSSARMEFGAGRPGGGSGGWSGGGYRDDGSITFWSGPNFTGRSVTLDRETSSFNRLGFNDQAMSAQINGYGSWTVCEDNNFGSPCRRIDRDIRNLNQIGLGNRISSARPDYDDGGLNGGYYPGGGYNDGYGESVLILFAGPNFTGPSVRVRRENNNLSNRNFNDQAMSAIVEGPDSWTVCEDANFGSPCRRIDRDIRNLNQIGLGNRITSVRPEPSYNYYGPKSGYRDQRWKG